MVLTIAGACAYHRKDGILIVPVGGLKDWYKENKTRFKY